MTGVQQMIGFRQFIMFTLTVATAFLGGCTAIDNTLIGNLGKNGDSYDRDGEQVSITMIPIPIPNPYDPSKNDYGLVNALKDAGVDDSTATKMYGNVFAQKSGKVVAFAAAAAAAAADFVVSEIQTEIKTEAARYEYQFTGTGYVDNYWSGKDYQYEGFEVSRGTGDDPNAFRLIVALVPIAQGRLLRVCPMFLETNHSGAKVPFWSDGVSTDIVITDNSTWIDKDNALKQQQVGNLTYSFGVHKFKVAQEWWTKNSDKLIIGVVGAPPLSVAVPATTSSKAGGDNSVPVVYDTDGGIIQLAVQVTEKDPTNAKQDLENVSKIVQDHQGDLAKYLAGRLGGSAAANDVQLKNGATSQPSDQTTTNTAAPKK
jgi:hypothetical protein